MTSIRGDAVVIHAVRRHGRWWIIISVILFSIIIGSCFLVKKSYKWDLLKPKPMGSHITFQPWTTWLGGKWR
jgi:hypothetical protein